MQIFYEIIQNAIDNYVKTKDKDNYYIKVDISPRSFTITNNGRVFDNQKLINDTFSNLNTSSHYTNKEEISAGTNGLGAKLVCMTQNTFMISNKYGKHVFKSLWKRGKLLSSEIVEDDISNNNYFSVFVELLP